MDDDDKKSDVHTANFWLAEERKVGEEQGFIMNLGCSKTVSSVSLKNTHNGRHRDRSTKKFRILGSTTNNGPWQELLVANLEDSRKQKPPPLQQLMFANSAVVSFIKFELLEFYGNGGGLQYFAVAATGTGSDADWEFCTSSRPCGYRRGDCDKDADCASGLKCGHDNCRDFWSQAKGSADCCIRDLELVGGSGAHEGNIFWKGKPVCDDTFHDNSHGQRNANVVCRMLGFSGGRFTRKSHFGRVPDDFSMDDVECVGTEQSILDCPHVDVDNCNGNEGAGVICNL